MVWQESRRMPDDLESPMPPLPTNWNSRPHFIPHLEDLKIPEITNELLIMDIYNSLS